MKSLDCVCGICPQCKNKPRKYPYWGKQGSSIFLFLRHDYSILFINGDVQIQNFAFNEVKSNIEVLENVVSVELTQEIVALTKTTVKHSSKW